MATLAEAVREARVGAGLTQVGLAKLLGKHPTSIVHREAGKSDVSGVELAKLAQVTRARFVVTADGWSVIGPDDALPDNPDRDSPYAVPGPDEGIPIAGWAGAGEPAAVLDQPEEWLDVTREWRNKVDGVIQIEGDSMSPFIRNGDFVGLRKSATAHPGDIVGVLDLRGQEMIVKVFWGCRANGEMVLVSYNPESSPMFYAAGTAEIIGTVWGVWRPGHAKARAF